MRSERISNRVLRDAIFCFRLGPREVVETPKHSSCRGRKGPASRSAYSPTRLRRLFSFGLRCSTSRVATPGQAGFCRGRGFLGKVVTIRQPCRRNSGFAFRFRRNTYAEAFRLRHSVFDFARGYAGTSPPSPSGLRRDTVAPAFRLGRKVSDFVRRLWRD